MGRGGEGRGGWWMGGVEVGEQRGNGLGCSL